MNVERQNKIIADLHTATGREWVYYENWGSEFRCVSDGWALLFEDGKYQLWSRSHGVYYGPGGRTPTSAIRRARSFMKEEIDEIQSLLSTLMPVI